MKLDATTLHLVNQFRHRISGGRRGVLNRRMIAPVDESFAKRTGRLALNRDREAGAEENRSYFAVKK
jgi:hypothetical protein